MEKAERDSLKLGRLRWLWFLPAICMFLGTRTSFGTVAALTLAAVFGFAFNKICRKGSRIIICEEIIKDMREGLDRAGFGDTVFEIKSLNIGRVSYTHLDVYKRQAYIRQVIRRQNQLIIFQKVIDAKDIVVEKIGGVFDMIVMRLKDHEQLSVFVVCDHRF